MKLIGPFSQAVTLSQLPLRGKLQDEDLEILPNAGLLCQGGEILEIDDFQTLKAKHPQAEIHQVESPQVVLPAYTDSHTHICFGGNRAADFAMRNAGKSYLEIAQNGGGIWSSVQHTRAASEEELLSGMLARVEALVALGITTIEVKSGYGLDLESELKMLRVIKKAQAQTKAHLVPTCLSAHTLPKDFQGDHQAYLDYIITEILPVVKAESLAERVDIFIEKSAFQPEESRDFLQRAKALGFQITVHADQFTSGSSKIAVEVGAKSADHLEVTTPEDARILAQSDTVATVLPGASLGLGEPFAPARILLDEGAIVAIASDWNPGSAPMGDLITQASILATFQKLSTAEVFAGLTFRAAYALGLEDRGRLAPGKKADFVTYATDDFRNILYHQGRLRPNAVFIDAEPVYQA
ncbi:imidazolonepropionase [Riemerella columbina]|uniref:imidazolonepropionase n=1 Tax=Riemerella columbina TaxID=103810 RepID=UPI00266F30FF|nr:imidazolonepropionase [Riemerella columbina]WKS95063.1 imidazolonepropionase [Riemerella columbina]